MTLAPYIEGPTLTIDTATGTMTADDVGVVFEWDPSDWKPAAGLTDEEEAQHLLGFAVAYAERPVEFDREPDAAEQKHAAWWTAHGDAMSRELPDA